MTMRPEFANIDLHLVKVLHTVISERSVSRAALRLGSTQPLVSAQLRRLRTLTGDALLVRGGTGMVPTDTAQALLAPAEHLLQEADRLFGRGAAGARFDPKRATHVVRVAASDYLDPLFLPGIVHRLQREAPLLQIEIDPLSADFDYRRKLATGEVDLVIGNWLQPPGELHLGRLTSDEVVCLVAADHPAVTNPRQWNEARYLDSDHVAPTALHAGGRGIIDEHLALQGKQRRITVRSAHFSLVPTMVAQSRLVLTTGRQFCLRHLGRLPVRIVRCPVSFPALAYYQLWHERTHASAGARWVREQVREVARGLAADAAGRPGGKAGA
ncbi:MAG: LysR family transcriptional regulator [Burkholderiales bacterium]|nr:LysR family transcriptional regulator [Burkholderiales bacterium]